MTEGDAQLNRVFHALADATRRSILMRIARHNPCVGELAAPFSMSAPAISKHLKTLEQAGLIQRVKEGKTHRFRINYKPLRHAESAPGSLEENPSRPESAPVAPPGTDSASAVNLGLINFE